MVGRNDIIFGVRSTKCGQASSSGSKIQIWTNFSYNSSFTIKINAGYVLRIDLHRPYLLVRIHRVWVCLWFQDHAEASLLYHLLLLCLI